MRPTRSSLLPTLLLLAGCVPLQPYHDAGPDGTLEVCQGDPATVCSRAYIEDHPQYLLGFVEFDDLGWAWDRDQGRELIRAIRAIEEDVLMVVFAHGWKHNAEACDTNVACFRDTLRGLYQAEQALAGGRGEGRSTPRRIVGVYVGWRGDAAKGRVPRQLSFFDRKATAHKVGSGAVTELLVRLKEEQAQRHRAAKAAAAEAARAADRQWTREQEATVLSGTRLVIVGHSFGGALMFSATSQLMMERLALAAVYQDAVRGLGDLVVLVNPAFEAARYQPLHQTLIEETRGPYPSDQEPVFAIFTSTGDGATGSWFPRGRSLSVTRDKHSSKFQKQANKAAVGHFEPFRSHFLEALPGAAELERVNEREQDGCGCPFGLAEAVQAETADEIRERLARLRRQRAGGETMRFGQATLTYEKGPRNSPIVVASVDDTIIKGHNDIYRPAFIAFLRDFIMLAAEY